MSTTGTTPSNAVRLSCNLERKGQLNLPGITAASKKAVEELLLKDAETHHCLFRASGFHNHLSHQYDSPFDLDEPEELMIVEQLAAYDMGATPALLQKIYDKEAQIQRPIIFKKEDAKVVVNEANWTQYLGNQSAYKAYVHFYAGEIKKYGAPQTVQKYVFSEEANTGERHMLVRLVSGALHPFIQIGYAAEFGGEMLTATALAQTTVHKPFSPSTFAPPPPPSSTEKTPTLLELLRKIYDSSALHPPMPYDPDALLPVRLAGALANGGSAALQYLVSTYLIPSPLTPAVLESVVEQTIHMGTLLTFATSKEGKKPRIDFFLMHILTSSLFLRPICENFLMGDESGKYAADLMRVYITVIMVVMLARGRPRINPGVLMSYTDAPRPPTPSSASAQPGTTSIGSLTTDGLYSPWPELILNVQYHPDPHVLKTMRTLIYGARQYGVAPAGGVLGAFVSGSEGTAGVDDQPQETHPSSSTLDGTLFVRSAGLLMDTLGWVAQGQNEGSWDRSALGWEGAWENDVISNAGKSYHT